MVLVMAGPLDDYRIAYHKNALGYNLEFFYLGVLGKSALYKSALGTVVLYTVVRTLIYEQPDTSFLRYEPRFGPFLI